MPNTYYIQDDGTIDRMETHPQNPLPPTLQQRLEAAESEAAALREQLAAVTRERDAVIDSAEYYKHTFLGMQTRIDELTAERNVLRQTMQSYIQEIFAHTAPPTDWDQETPLGQALDGLGDEVE